MKVAEVKSGIYSAKTGIWNALLVELAVVLLSGETDSPLGSDCSADNLRARKIILH